MELHPIEDKDWPASLEEVRDTFAGRLNVYRVMAHHPALLAAWAPLREHVVLNGALGKQRSEIVILRTGVRTGSSYEWAHHVSRGRACGIPDARLASIAGPLDEMEPGDRILCAAVDELFARHRLPPALQEEVVQLAGTDGLLDLMATVGFYTVLGFILGSFNVPLEPEITEELAKNPLPAGVSRTP